MRSIIKYLAVLMVLLTLCSATSATRITKTSATTFNLYTDSGILKGTLSVPGLIDYEWRNNILYTLTSTKFATMPILDPSKPISITSQATGIFYDMDLNAGTKSGSIFIASNKGLQQYFIKSSDRWQVPILKAVYKPTESIKTVDASSSGVKIWTHAGARYQYFWKSDGYLIITDAWL